MKRFFQCGLCGILALACLLMTVSGCASDPTGNSNNSADVSDATHTGSLAGSISADSDGVGSDQQIASDASSESGTEQQTSLASGSTSSEGVTSSNSQTGSSEHYVHSAGKTFQNMTFSYASVQNAVNISNKYSYQALGDMQIEDYPIDGVYDQAFNCIKVGDTYKMWWGRACPYDTIWYAESKDMKNWYNAQCVLDLKGYETTWIKQMMLWSSVLYVNGKYHMFFEAPATIDSGGEYNNNIFYATSPDGLDWTFYPNNKNPQPVIKNPNTTGRAYGVGQPKAFYKDGTFYVIYTDASTGGGDIRVAKSVGNGYSFTGTVPSHTKILSGIAGAAVRYNETTGKYYMTVAADANSGSQNSMGIYMQESDDLYSWPYSSISQLKIKGAVLASPSEVTKKANPDFVTNEFGIVTGENMIFMYMDGVMPGAAQDHRVTHTTWDGRLGVLTVGSLYGKTATLPNGKPATAANLVWYQDLVAKWVQPTCTAASGTPKMDGSKDSVYSSSTALVESVTWEGENSKPTDTTGKANFAWDSNALYVYIMVKDDTPLANDGVTVFVHAPGATGDPTADNAYWLTVGTDGSLAAENEKGTNITSSLGADAKVEKSSGGYSMEIKIPWYATVKSQIKKGVSIGLDLCINDNIGMVRSARVFWSNYAARNESTLNQYGKVTLG